MESIQDFVKKESDKLGAWMTQNLTSKASQAASVDTALQAQRISSPVVEVFSSPEIVLPTPRLSSETATTAAPVDESTVPGGSGGPEYATKEWVLDQIEGLATEEWVSEQLEGVATEEWVENKLDSYATKEWVESKLVQYVKKEELKDYVRKDEFSSLWQQEWSNLIGSTQFLESGAFDDFVMRQDLSGVGIQAECNQGNVTVQLTGWKF